MGDLAAGYLAWRRWVHFGALTKLKSVANYLPYTQRWRWHMRALQCSSLQSRLRPSESLHIVFTAKTIVSSYDSPYILLPSASTFFGLRKDRCSSVSARGRSSTSQPECAGAYQWSAGSANYIPFSISMGERDRWLSCAKGWKQIERNTSCQFRRLSFSLFGKRSNRHGRSAHQAISQGHRKWTAARVRPRLAEAEMGTMTRRKSARALSRAPGPWKTNVALNEW